MKKLFTIFFGFFLIFTNMLKGEELSPNLLDRNDFTFPLRYRTAKGVIQSENDPLDISGLENLPASASGQFSEKELDYILHSIPAEKFIIFDLRKECHGFVNGYPVAWKTSNGDYFYNEGLSSKQIEQKEENFLEQLLKSKKATFLTEKGTIELPVERVFTERELAEKKGVQYLRFPLRDHHFPDNEQVQTIEKFLTSLPKGTWVHFHCAGGAGRTTVLFSMLDILFHPHLPLETILRRQEKIGGSNLYDPVGYYTKINRPERIQDGKERLEFLNLFHLYWLCSIKDH